MLRSARLFRLFLAEQSDPDGFYTALARDAASQLANSTLAAAPDMSPTNYGRKVRTAICSSSTPRRC